MKPNRWTPEQMDRLLEGVRPLLDTRWLQSIFGEAFEFL
jgi:hypothetical protein